MTKFLLLTCFVFISITGVNTAYAKRNNKHKLKNTDSVFVCLGSMSYTYHLTDTCKGFLQCFSPTTKITVDTAMKKYDRKPCKLCLFKR